MKILSIIFLVGYITASAANIYGRFIKSDLNNYITKPFLMPLLLGFYLAMTAYLNVHVSLLIIAALVFATIGDILLMLPGTEKDPPFIIGMFAFLAGHLMYFFYFLWHSIPLQHTFPVIIGIVLIIPVLILFYIFIYHSHHAIWPALWAYGTMTGMLIVASTTTFGIGPYCGSFFLLIGTLVFGFSDFCIALQQIHKLKDGKALVMITYTVAQLLLNIGIIILAN